MPKGKSPAFQFYASDFLVDEKVKLMNLQERGAYITLLAHCWIEKSIPQNIEALAILCDIDKIGKEIIWQKVSKCFYLKDGRLHNRRLQEERAKQRQRSAKMSENAAKQWRTPSRQKLCSKNKSLHSKSYALQSSSSVSSSTSVTTNPPTPLEGGIEDFGKPSQNGEKPYPLKKELPIPARIICAWKEITGYPYDDRTWDKTHWARHAKSAKSLLEFFQQDYKAAIQCCQGVYEELKKKSLECTIETVVKRSAEWKIKNENPKH